MTVKISTGLKANLLSNKGVRESMQGGQIAIYQSPRPSSPNSAVVYAPLAYITQDGEAWEYPDVNEAGLLYDVYAGGIALMSGEWRVKGARTGTATWFRITGPDPDYGNTSLTLPRIDGDCGTELKLPSYSITPSLDEAIEAFEIHFA